MMTYTSTDRDGSNLSFKTRNELGALAVEKLCFISRCVEGVDDWMQDVRVASLVTCSG